MVKPTQNVTNTVGYTNPYALPHWPTYTHMMQTPFQFAFSGQQIPRSPTTSTINEGNSLAQSLIPNTGNQSTNSNHNTQTPAIQYFPHPAQNRDTTKTQDFQSVHQSSFSPGGSKTSG